MAANEAAERNDAAGALAFWSRLRAMVPAGSEVAKSIDANVAKVREAAGINAASTLAARGDAVAVPARTSNR